MNQPLGLFQIKIHSAENLPKSDIIGDIHSYVKFSINSFSDKIIRETSTIKKHLILFGVKNLMYGVKGVI